MLVMITDAVPLWAQQILVIAGAEIIRAETIPYNFIGAPAYARDKWREAVVKLRMFQMTRFAKIVFLDADVLVQGNVDDLFELPFSEKVQLYGAIDLHDCMVRIG